MNCGVRLMATYSSTVIELIRSWMESGDNGVLPILADALQEEDFGEHYLLKKMRNKKLTEWEIYRLEDMALMPELHGYDWWYCFKDGGIPDSEGEMDKSPFDRKDVARVDYYIEGENDEASWIMVGKLKDERYFQIVGSCCYTGWEAQGGANSEVWPTLDLALASIHLQDLHRLGGKYKEDPLINGIISYKEREGL